MLPDGFEYSFMSLSNSQLYLEVIAMKSLDFIVLKFLCVVRYLRVDSKIPGRFKCTIWSNNIGGVGQIFL